MVAHPPCRAWGRLRHFARPRPDEKTLALFAVNVVRSCGGVLEHPAGSTLWPAAKLPELGTRDAFGGWTLPVLQYWWGHKAAKATWLYIVGCEPADVPPIPLALGEPLYVVASDQHRRPEITKAEREHTPRALAMWLIELARRCEPSAVRS